MFNPNRAFIQVRRPINMPFLKSLGKVDKWPRSTAFISAQESKKTVDSASNFGIGRATNNIVHLDENQ